MTGLFLFLAWQAAAVGTPQNAATAMRVYQQGHAAFGAKNWPVALDCYGAVERFLARSPTAQNLFDHHFRGFSATDVVRARRALGLIQPTITHRILVLYIDKVDAAFPGGRVQSQFTPQLKMTAEASQEACARMVEVLSGGRVTLEFTRLDLHATLTELSAATSLNNEAEAVETVQAVVESLTPYPAELIRQHLERCDSFLWYWNDQNLKTTRGGHATALGGSASLPLVPGLLSAPERGRLIVSAALLNRPGTLLHELFHTFERCYGIAPLHGFRTAQRKSFPDWKGDGEFDYYRYHFQRIGRDTDFAGFNFCRRFPCRISAELLTHDAELARTLKPEELHGPEPYAVKLRKEGLRLHSQGAYDQALNLFARIYAIDPLDAETCYWIGLESYRTNNPQAAIRYFDEGLLVNPQSAKILQYRGVVHFAQGRHAQAAADFKAAIALDGKQAAAIRDFLQSRVKRGEAAAAETLAAAGLKR